MIDTVVVIAKAPAPGRSKTRLAPPCTPLQAAALAEAALIDTLETVERSSAHRRVLALDGEVGGLLENLEGFEVIRQRGVGLGERLAAAFEDTGESALLIGMDTPQMSPSLLDRALELLSRTDAVLGDTVDGGYWAIGLRYPFLPAFTGVPMSTRLTAHAQRQRLAQLGLASASLPILRDVDYYDDAVAVAAQVSGSRFARCFASLRLGLRERSA
jgi:rSAM/selenodomain-associated transferase 1